MSKKDMILATLMKWMHIMILWKKMRAEQWNLFIELFLEVPEFNPCSIRDYKIHRPHQIHRAPPESQRDSIIQPRVGAQLPWVSRPKIPTLKGLHQIRANGFNPFRVAVISFHHPA
jgi:hypothetical protein